MNSLIYRKKTLGYLVWRWLLGFSGSFVSWLDSCYFGYDRGFNGYNLLAENYDKSNVKEDKLYSILPTVLFLSGDLRNKIVSDLGCGAGFFTVPLFKKGAHKVYGLDNSIEQLNLAKKYGLQGIEYKKLDIFQNPIPESDVIIAPFVSNYSRTIPILKHFFNQIFESLTDEGRLVLVVDLPNGKSLQKFGAEKSFINGKKDEGKISIKLFSQNKPICELEAVYFKPETIEKTLKEVGFNNIHWNNPIISNQGKKILGKDFWEGYIDDPELGYLTAEKR